MGVGVGAADGAEAEAEALLGMLDDLVERLSADKAEVDLVRRWRDEGLDSHRAAHCARVR